MIRMKGGGGAPSVTRSTNVTSSLPEYARPYYEDLLGRATYETTRPYQPYPGQRMSYFDPYESMAQEGTAQLAVQGAPTQINSATDIATQVGYQPTGQGMDIARQFQPPTQQSNYLGLTQGMQSPSQRTDYLDLVQGMQSPAQRTDYYGGSLADPSRINAYMNPYQQNVTDIQKRAAVRQSKIQGNEIAGQAAQAGGLGGYRESIMQSERQRNLNESLNNMQAQGNLAGYQQAVQGIEADRRSMMDEDTRRMTARQQNTATTEARAREADSRMMAARQQNTATTEARIREADSRMMDARQQNAGLMQQRSQLGLAGLGQDMAMRDQSLKAAGMLGDLGKADQSMGLERLGALGGVGEIRRGMAQRSMDTGYEDYLRQRTFPYQQLNVFSQMLQGLPVNPDQTRSLYGGPSAAQQALGAGIGGLGLYRSLRG